jgi:hypothetical protein
VLLAELVAIPGCLNPRPEEDPSALQLEPGGDLAPAADTPAPERETCEDNALLAGCEPPPSAVDNGNAGSPPPASEEPAEPADAGGATSDDAGGADAGAPAPAGSSVAE